eukprot:TRINITY_DN11743_c0_g1_i1.p1 TRINITY_DN11743_c0_g1~~TRINITY_DN11743_c0_g1_i1.p1  ORF type:complete len:1294 (-),score=265.82 TRINITY_DN11743_c0_g1_i1:10-3423(-)
MAVVPNTRPEQVADLVQTLVTNFAASLLDEFEHWVRNVDRSPVPITSLDDDMLSDVAVVRKRKRARLTKIIGDYCLLAGSPLDAIEHYKESLSLTKSNDDYVWMAGSIEGLACANIEAGPRVERQSGDVLARLEEATTLYLKKGATALAVEATIKIARFGMSTKRRDDASRHLTTASRIAENLSARDQIALALELARVYDSMGFKRKASFAVMQAARQCALVDEWAGAHTLLLRVANTHFMDDLKGGPSREGGWADLQQSVLQDLRIAARKINDPQADLLYVAYTLYKRRKDLAPDQQLQYLKELRAVGQDIPPMKISRERTPLQLTHVTGIRPLPLAPERAPIKIKERDPSQAIFIVQSFAAHNEEKGLPTYVAGELMQLNVSIRNPFSFPVTMSAITLVVEGGVFESYPGTLRIGPLDHRFVTVSAIAPEPGEFAITGCNIAIHNLVYTSPLAKPVQILIVPRLPLLIVRECELNAALLRLCNTQRHTLQFEVTNAGPLPVNAMNITTRHLADTSVPANCVVCDKSAASEPLLPGQAAMFPVTLTAAPGMNGVKFAVEYSSTNVAYSRRMEIDVPLRVQDGIKVNEFVLESLSDTHVNVTVCVKNTCSFAIGVFSSVSDAAVTDLHCCAHCAPDMSSQTFVQQPGAARMIPAFGRSWITMRVQRFTLTDEVIRLLSDLGSAFKLTDRERCTAYSKALSQRLHLCWTSPHFAFGCIWLERLPLPKNGLLLLPVPTIGLQVLVNGVTPDAVTQLTCNDLHSLRITLSSEQADTSPAVDLRVRIIPFISHDSADMLGVNRPSDPASSGTATDSTRTNSNVTDGPASALAPLHGSSGHLVTPIRTLSSQSLRRPRPKSGDYTRFSRGLIELDSSETADTDESVVMDVDEWQDLSPIKENSAAVVVDDTVVSATPATPSVVVAPAKPPLLHQHHHRRQLSYDLHAGRNARNISTGSLEALSRPPAATGVPSAATGVPSGVAPPTVQLRPPVVPHQRHSSADMRLGGFPPLPPSQRSSNSIQGLVGAGGSSPSVSQIQFQKSDTAMTDVPSLPSEPFDATDLSDDDGMSNDFEEAAALSTHVPESVMVSGMLDCHVAEWTQAEYQHQVGICVLDQGDYVAEVTLVQGELLLATRRVVLSCK